MIKKALYFIALSLISGVTCATPETLDSYELIKKELLEGRVVKVIVEFAKCKVVNGDNKGIHHTIGLRIDNFMISGRTNELLTSHSFLNSLDKINPYGLKGYRRGDISIKTTNDVVIDTDVITLPEFKTLGAIRFLCKINEGTKFYKAV